MKVISRTASQAVGLCTLPLNPLRVLLRALYQSAPRDWQGLGLLTLASIPSLLYSATAEGGNGVHINANNDLECLSLNDPPSTFSSGDAATVNRLLMAETIKYKDTESGKCNPANKSSQSNAVMFYRPVEVAGIGATSLSLGDELYINSGRLMLGAQDGSMAIGQLGDAKETTRWELIATNGGMAVGRSAQATALGSMAWGVQSTARNPYALAVGNMTSANGLNTVALGSASTAAGESAVTLGASAQAGGASAFAAGRFAQASGAQGLALGRDSSAALSNSVALGYTAKSREVAGITLGSNSETSALHEVSPVNLNEQTYEFDSSSAIAPISFGKNLFTYRQLLNLGPGSISPSSLDAVNGAQLQVGYTAIQQLGDRESLGSQSLAEALGLPKPGADGQMVLPSLSLASLGPNIAQPTTLLGAVKALDQRSAQTDERMGAVFDDAVTTALAFDALNSVGRLRWDAEAGTYDASHGERAVNRITDLAAGVAGTDAVNKGQLDVVEGSARGALSSANEAAVQARQVREAAAAVEAAAQHAQTTAAQAGRDAAESRTLAEAAQATAHAAQTAAAGAQGSAAAAQRDADSAGDTVAKARGTTELAQRDADQAGQRAAQASQAALAAQQGVARASSAADTARNDVQAAQREVETARDTASQALAEAEQAQRSAGAAEQVTVAARSAADAARGSAADAAQLAHEQQVAAQAAQAQADGARDAALAAQASARAAQDTALGASVMATDAQTVAGTAQRTADTAAANATQAGQAVQAAQGTSDSAHSQATTAQANAQGAQASGEHAAASAAAAQSSAEAAQTSADSAQVLAADALNVVQASARHADDVLRVAQAARQAAGQSQDAAAQALEQAQTTRQVAQEAQVRADQSAASATAAGRAVDAAQTAATAASTAALEAGQVATSAQRTSAQASETAQAAQGMVDQARETSARASDIGRSAQQTAERAELRAGAAADAATTAQQAADAALATGQTAQTQATQASHAADAGHALASAALGDAQQASQAAVLAQARADEATNASEAAQRSGDAAQGHAATAMATATAAGDRAQAARQTAGQATAAADTALHTAAQAQTSAQAAKANTDGVADRLQGVASDETVVQRIDTAVRQAASKAADYLVQVLGGDARIGTDGQPVAPSYGIDRLSADGSSAPTAHGNVGSALSAVDGSAMTLNTTVQGQGATLDGLGGQVRQLHDDSVLWGPTQGSYNAGRGEQDTPARIGDLADGAQPNDAVNKRQLDTVEQGAHAASELAETSHQRAEHARLTGLSATTAAAWAQQDAERASRSAEQAVGLADEVQRSAQGVQRDAQQTGRDADQALAKLQGLNEGETVIEQIDNAERAARQTMNTALVEQALVGTDATVQAPRFSLNNLGVTAGSVGQALDTLDDAAAQTHTRVEQTATDLRDLNRQLAEGEVGMVRQAPVSRDIQLARDNDGDRLDVAGREGARTVGGLQDGAVHASSSDAVTGRQLNAVNEHVDQLDQQRAVAAVDSRDDGSDRAVAAPESQALAVGSNARAEGQGSAAVGADAQASASRSTAMGAGAEAGAANSVALGAGAHASRADSVAVGSAGRERQVTQVAGATQGTDAVNLRQASRLSSGAGAQSLRQANAYTDRRVGQLSQDVYAGIASAMAMAGLPAASSPGKSMLAMATAVYENQPAVAVGLSARSNSGRWTYSATGTGTARGDYGVNLGLGYHW